MTETENSMDSNRIAYLAQIQGVINRMSTVSATCKGFSATMFAGVLAIVLSLNGNNRVLALVITAIPILAFACFDCYYFAKELQYRELYNKVLSSDLPADFSMAVGKISGSIVRQTLASKSIWLFYLAFIFCYIVITIMSIVGSLS